MKSRISFSYKTLSARQEKINKSLEYREFFTAVEYVMYVRPVSTDPVEISCSAVG